MMEDLPGDPDDGRGRSRSKAVGLDGNVGDGGEILGWELEAGIEDCYDEISHH